MLANDEIALVSFDDLIATPAPMQAVSAGAVPPVLSGTDLDPRGLTCIGGGILQGATELGLATHTNRSMVVLTDGIENVHPYVIELPAGTITNRTYAIGFGLPGDVSTAVLQQITSNTHGDLIITGNISTAEQALQSHQVLRAGACGRHQHERDSRPARLALLRIEARDPVRPDRRRCVCRRHRTVSVATTVGFHLGNAFWKNHQTVCGRTKCQVHDWIAAWPFTG